MVGKLSQGYVPPFCTRKYHRLSTQRLWYNFIKILNKILLFIAFENEENKCDCRDRTKIFAFKYTTRQYLFPAQNHTISLSSLHNVFDSNVRSGGRTRNAATIRASGRDNWLHEGRVIRQMSSAAALLASPSVRLHLTSSHNNLKSLTKNFDLNAKTHLAFAVLLRDLRWEFIVSTAFTDKTSRVSVLKVPKYRNPFEQRLEIS